MSDKSMGWLWFLGQILFLLFWMTAAFGGVHHTMMTLGIVNSPNAVAQKVYHCTQVQIDYYADLCQESSTGYEDMSPGEAHFEGVKCASESIKECLK